MKHTLTNGSIPRALLSFSAPMILGNLLQQLYNVADTMIVGKAVGAVGLSAVGSAYALMVLLTSIVLGLCMGSSVVFSRFYASGQQQMVRKSLFNAMLFIFAFSVVINVVSVFMIDAFVQLLQVPPQAAGLAAQYMRIVFAGFSFVSVYNFFACALRSIGNTKAPLLFLGVAAAINVLLDLLFVLGFGWGVQGAAVATVVAQAVSALLILIYFLRCAKGLIPQKRDCLFDKQLFVNIAKNATLTAVQQSIMNFGILMVQSLVNSFGTAVSAAFAIVVKIDAFAYMPAQDFGNAFATFTAQNQGAGNHQRLHKGFACAVKLTLCFCALASIVVNLCAVPLMGLFLKENDPSILSIGIQYLGIEGALYVGIGLLFLLYGYYRGVGKAGISVVLTIISLGSRVLLAYALSAIPAVGVVGIWWAVPLGWALADAVGVCYYMKQKSTKNV